MNEFDIFKNFENEEDFKMCDLTPNDIENLTKKSKTSEKFKEDYFNFYDDIKSHTKKEPQDWWFFCKKNKIFVRKTYFWYHKKEGGGKTCLNQF